MTFTSLSYFLFLPIVYLIFYFAKDSYRWLVLLIASYGFYATFKAPYLLAVLLMVTAISYACGLRIAAYKDEAICKRWFWSGTIACVAILALLKYLPFLENNAYSIFGLSSTLTTALISIGVSYFSFQAISYLADIYLEIEEPERRFGAYALYMAFFPKLLQGPIERAGDLLPQLKQSYQFDYDTMRSGILLFTLGLFKKVVIADRLALYADQVFNHVHDYTGLPLIIGTYAYAFQIYFDFSGYTDMARGTARLFGINLTENFNSPYLATSIADFWRRWHISFSRWILDYIFKPLQMSWRSWGQSGTAAALIITFLVSGLWHGATWGFIIWGLLHGVYLASSTYYRPYQKRLHKWLGVEKSRWLKWLQILTTFNLVSFAWIFFKSATLNDAMYVVNNMLSFASIKLDMFSSITGGKRGIVFAVLCIISVTIIESSRNTKDHIQLMYSCRWRWFIYYITLMTILVCGIYGKSEFLYGRF